MKIQQYRWNKVRFEVNLHAAKRSGLKVISKLLSVAIVQGEL